MKTWKKMNINDYVRVRLTAYGKECHKRNHDSLVQQFAIKLEYHAPKEDGGGWSKWQLWSLMNHFGPHIMLGNECPFLTELEVEVEQ